MNYSKYIASFAVFLMGLLISFGLSNGSRTEMQEAAVQNAFNMRATVAGSYKSLSAEIDMGLRQSGVAPTWRDYALKKVETLKKQGLDAKKVAELRAKIAKLSVGGETGGQAYARYTETCASSSLPVFTHAFTDLEKIKALNPIGGIGGGSPGRSYIGVKDGMEAPLYAPMNATLHTIVYADRGAGYGEYGLIFEAGCGVEFMFDHMDSLSDTLLPYAPKTAATSSQVQNNQRLRIPVKAGQLLGYSDGTDLAHTFDFFVMNYGKKNKFLNPARWEWEQALYATCPYDYFTPTLRAQYYNKLGKPTDTGIVKASTCGNPSHDVAGSIAGGWFKSGSTDKRGEYLAIARDYDSVQIAYRKDGDAFASRQNVQAGVPYFRLTDSSPAKFPAEVKVRETICYQDGQSFAFAKLISEKELALVRGNGICPAEFPETGTEKWLR